MSASSLVEAVPVVETREEEWSLATRVAFRFCFAFFLLYNLPFPLNVIPQLNMDALANRAWTSVIALVAQPRFGMAADNSINGSGRPQLLSFSSCSRSCSSGLRIDVAPPASVDP